MMAWRLFMMLRWNHLHRSLSLGMAMFYGGVDGPSLGPEDLNDWAEGTLLKHRVEMLYEDTERTPLVVECCMRVWRARSVIWV
jgi:hypothetical protein